MMSLPPCRRPSSMNATTLAMTRLCAAFTRRIVRPEERDSGRRARKDAARDTQTGSLAAPSTAVLVTMRAEVTAALWQPCWPPSSAEALKSQARARLACLVTAVVPDAGLRLMNPLGWSDSLASREPALRRVARQMCLQGAARAGLEGSARLADDRQAAGCDAVWCTVGKVTRPQLYQAHPACQPSKRRVSKVAERPPPGSG